MSRGLEFIAVRFCVRDVLRAVPDATFVRSLLAAPACFAGLADFGVDLLPLAA